MGWLLWLLADGMLRWKAEFWDIWSSGGLETELNGSGSFPVLSGQEVTLDMFTVTQWWLS